ncbi:hypothetical protein GCM10014719_59750 [Planomonospora parontospora subsp. antibiotica]|nr:hypothetical protein GCM10014719_59750 [Planomonospora parontospora subsp. antibiotica]GII18993.1 hypothetical protein Ppa05_57190 [Planomonospora parontospora subsp. antibiotica]
MLNVVRAVFSFSGHEEEVGEGCLIERDHYSLARAQEILVKTMPNLTANTLSLVRLLVVLRTDIPSWYLTQIPESIGLGENLLRRESDLVIAECLLHECLHEKYTLMRLVRALVRPGYSDHNSPGVMLPWSLSMGERRVFKVNRLLSTLHVYAHLSAFHSAVLRTPGLGAHHAQAADRIRTNFERASYINQALQWTEVSCHLGGDGHALRDWLDRTALGFVRETSDVLGLGLQAYPTDQWTHDDLIEV